MRLGLLAIALAGPVCADTDCPVGPIPYCVERQPLAADAYGVRYRLASGVALGVRVHEPEDAPRELVVVAPDRVPRRLCHDLGGVGWDALGEVAGSTRALAALQNESEGQGGDVTIVRTNDGGRTWAVVGCVAPPHWSGVVQRLDMRSARRGTLTFELFDVGPDAPPAGPWRVETRDGGRSWRPVAGGR